MDGYTKDVYVNGKLARTCVVDHQPSAPTEDIKILPHDCAKGKHNIQGYLTRLRVKPSSSTPNEIFSEYKKGWGGSMFSRLAGQYKLKVAFLHDDIVQKSYEFY